MQEDRAPIKGLPRQDREQEMKMGKEAFAHLRTLVLRLSKETKNALYHEAADQRLDF